MNFCIIYSSLETFCRESEGLRKDKSMKRFRGSGKKESWIKEGQKMRRGKNKRKEEMDFVTQKEGVRDPNEESNLDYSFACYVARHKSWSGMCQCYQKRSNPGLNC